MVKGRQAGGAQFTNMILLFGDIFCTNTSITRENWTRTIHRAELTVSEMIPVNSEALMITILETGCRKDWPAYWQAFGEWEQHKNDPNIDREKLKKPVSKMTNENGKQS